MRTPNHPRKAVCIRCVTANALLADGLFDADGIRTVLGDRSEDALSISRHPEDGEATATNACGMGVPATARSTPAAVPPIRAGGSTSSSDESSARGHLIQHPAEHLEAFREVLQPHADPDVVITGILEHGRRHKHQPMLLGAPAEPVPRPIPRADE